jgi:hypothetical protein
MNRAMCAIVLIVLAAGLLCAAGCTAPSPEEIGPTPAITAPPTTEPAPLITEKILILDSRLEGLGVEFEASEGGKDDNNIIISYTLDNSGGMVGAPGERLDLMLTAFAYNYDQVPADFNPRSYQDIIEAGIPYKSARIGLYQTVYNDRIEPGAVPGTDPLDITRPYNYGLVIRPEP